MTKSEALNYNVPHFSFHVMLLQRSLVSLSEDLSKEGSHMHRSSSTVSFAPFHLFLVICFKGQLKDIMPKCELIDNNSPSVLFIITLNLNIIDPFCEACKI